MGKSIKKPLGITDLNIEFNDTQPEQFHEEVIKGQTVTVWHFKLTYHRRCAQCGFTLNNNGTKSPSQWLPLQLLRNSKAEVYLCELWAHSHRRV